MRFALLFLLFFSGVCCAFAQHLDFELTTVIGSPVNDPYDVAIDKKGDIFLLEKNEVTKIDAGGRLVERISLNANKSRVKHLNLEMDQAGNFYASDKDAYNAVKFSPQGLPLLRFGSRGNGPGQFESVGPMALDAQENVYVADPYLARIQKFNPQGQFMQQIGPGAGLQDTLHYVVDVGLDGQGNVYVLDAISFYGAKYSVFKFSPAGTLLQKFNVTQPSPSYNSVRAQSMTVARDGGFYLFYSFSREVIQFDLNGRQVRKFSDQSVQGSGMADGVSLAQDDAGNIFAASHHWGASYIRKFTSHGAFLRQYGHDQIFTSLVYGPYDNLFAYESSKSEIHQYDAAGNLKLKFPTADPPVSGGGNDIIAVDWQGNLYALAPWAEIRIRKFTNKGVLIREFRPAVPKPANGNYLRNLVVDRAGFMYISDTNGGVVHKLDAAGKYVQAIGKPGAGPGELSSPRSVALDGLGFIYIQDTGGHRIQKFSPAGHFLMAYGDLRQNLEWNFSNLAVDKFGNALLSVRGNGDHYLEIYDRYGSLKKKITLSTDEIAVNPAGDAFATLVHKDGTLGVYASKTRPQQHSYITGNIFEAPDGSCLAVNQKPLAGIPVVAEPGPFFGLSDEAGNYVIPVDTGRYLIRAALPQEPGRTITPTCPTGPVQPVIVGQYGLSVNGPNFGNQVSTAPYLQVQVTSNRRRRCFRNITTISYSNSGFAAAPNARVTVRLPDHVYFISASAAHTLDSKGNYTFALGDLSPGQLGNIKLIDSVSCADPGIRGLTVCTQAWITPVNTYPAPADWNKADIRVSGHTLENGQARFVIRNAGAGPMTDSLFFRVYQEEGLALLSKYKLAAHDSLVLRFTPSGQAVRVEVDQPAGHPLKATAGLNLQVKKRVAFSPPALLMMAYPPDDPEPEISQDCQPIIDSFDPNDKQVVPVGITQEHYTPTHAPLRYTLRFQNTGTDYAYRVEVVDTLAASLDLGTLQVGGASHPYRLSVSGKHRPVLTFTFDNIMLPDSTRDQAGSNGFVQFSIKPKAHLPKKEKIENYADIFFDYNEPVRTNTTVNRIFDMPLKISGENQLLSREVMGSPVIESFTPGQSRAGALIRIRGHHLALQGQLPQVTFNGVAATVLGATDSTVTVQVPSQAFTGRIKVQTPDGVGQSSVDFRIFQPPTLTAVSPPEATPGEVITLTGTNFSADAAQDTVTLNGLAARVLEAAETALKVEVPSGATLGPILVKTLGGQAESSQSFMVWYPPVITGFSPGKGKVGTEVVLNGRQFAESAPRNQVRFGNVQAQVLEASAGRLLVKVPAAAQSGKIRVQTPGGTAFSPTDFIFIPAPEITSFTPGQGNAGTTVTLTGRNFNADGQADTVYFNGLQAKVLQASETKLEVQAPKGVESGTITVAGAGGRTVAAGFQVPLLAPTEAITVYPNPTKAGVTINWFKANFTVDRMEIYNAIGKLVAEKDLKGAAQDEQGFLLDSFGPGVFILRIHTSAGTVVKQVVAL